jgi:cation diffusion facilitator CzcD-associated flavoprotein CzcO
MNDICIIGAGVTGLSMLLLLQEAKADLSKVVIIDPNFDGGDLARLWTAVKSNTPWSKTVNALMAACPSLNLAANEHQPSETTKLVDIAHLFRRITAPALKQAKQIQGYATSADYTDAWTVHINAAGKPLEIRAKKLILAPGGEPKKMDLPIPSIPLEIALDATRIQHYVKPGDKTLVFGTLHSGTLVIRNLVAAGANVTAFYNSPLPFYWARDGAYDGIKEEAAEIADDIVAGKLSVELVPVQDSSKLIRSSYNADWVVYAMGFTSRNTIQLSVGGVAKPVEYNGSTGQLTFPASWGFGVAYPNLAPDGVHWDVSVAAFLEHIKPQIPTILQP